ncbi:MAG: hypothetical protein A2W19_01315 [Spirochaetes bacterium RBG_16_49_21]|nr:MAG: hypothetical protein A2W19_01315 [Spirochaetes bacterium RBG_16_49_21]
MPGFSMPFIFALSVHRVQSEKVIEGRLIILNSIQIWQKRQLRLRLLQLSGVYAFAFFPLAFHKITLAAVQRHKLSGGAFTVRLSALVLNFCEGLEVLSTKK